MDNYWSRDLPFEDSRNRGLSASATTLGVVPLVRLYVSAVDATTGTSGRNRSSKSALSISSFRRRIINYSLTSYHPLTTYLMLPTSPPTKSRCLFSNMNGRSGPTQGAHSGGRLLFFFPSSPHPLPSPPKPRYLRYLSIYMASISSSPLSCFSVPDMTSSSLGLLLSIVCFSG